MSITWMTRVWEEATGVKETALLVLLSIADHAGDDDPVAWPSVARLAQRTRCDERTIQRALVTLEESGWLTRTMRPGHSTMYRIHRPGGDTDVTPDKLSPPTQVSPHPRQARHPRGDTGVTQNHQGTTSEPGGGEETTSSERAVTAQPFPAFAKAALDKVTPAEREEWRQAWRQVCATTEEWPPTLHLTKYLARCTETKREPRPAEWLRWFAEDERKARSEGAASLPTDDTPQWWE